MELYDGGCTCRYVRYRMTSRPLFVHCCHCSWCQRETGSAFVLNALIEAERVEFLSGQPDVILNTKLLAKGTYVITIRIGGDQDYVTGMILN